LRPPRLAVTPPVFVCLVGLLCTACGGDPAKPAAPVELRVSAAVSLTEALQPIGASFERQSGVRIQPNLAGSNTLAAQILEGAAADVFISADAAQMDRVDQANALLPATRLNLLSNSLVIIVPTGATTLTGPRDLLRTEVRHVALGDPAAVPAGVYARQYLERAGLWTLLQPKIVPLPHVRAVMTAVASGAADAGIVYKTDAVAVARGTQIAWTVPPGEAPAIVYPAAVLKTTTHPDEARAFVRFLQSPDASRIFTAAGFVPLAADAQP
jgi:molybdate transport system substrate-binding protein